MAKTAATKSPALEASNKNPSDKDDPDKMTTRTSTTDDCHATTSTFTLTLAALGIVYGDIGTSPLYAFRECFHGPFGLPPTQANVFGVLSIIIWSLLLIISVKYAVYVLKADNRGEGGILTLTSLVHPHNRSREKDRLRLLLWLGLFGSALLYGDGIITPAVSVLSAIEGLRMAAPSFDPLVVPMTLVVLISLFLLQRRGTQKIGLVFGPILLVWFLTIAILGIIKIFDQPQVLVAISPHYALDFFRQNGTKGFWVLGSTVLVVTGGEALYADMGHFGRLPIRLGWFLLVLPALLLNYLGQGALLLSHPEAASNPFYKLAPDWALYPLIALATISAVIASQALISGVFSLTRQAIQMGYLPRMEIVHTSAAEQGQIYLPSMNWALCLATCLLVLSFKTSSALAGAYGMAVTLTMFITTILIYYVARYRWKWNRYLVLSLSFFFLSIDFSFVAANFIKVIDGGWVPLAAGIAIFTLMSTWQRGRALLAKRMIHRMIPLNKFLESLTEKSIARVDGTAVFMATTLDGTPPALLHNVKHNHVLHKTVIILKVATLDVPRVAAHETSEVKEVSPGIFKIALNYGFMDSPNIPNALRHCKIPGIKLDVKNITYFLGRETLLATHREGMAIWREMLFTAMSRNAHSAMGFFHLPTAQVVEIGIQVEL
ncbi:MAG: potassium transporter Kup [Oligoflexales bacterium]|nr:potassium transporter Kup [Oligoflexales bacterium]